tara:strand:+ start:471 stop:839 length:369 start_codon:yes stop_codon:yes gene_type:complete
MMKSNLDFISNQPLLKEIINLALEKKAGDLKAIDIRGISYLSDFFIICHGESEPHVKAITDNIRKGTTKKPRHIEGYENQNWILLDYFDIIIHIFKKSEREYYSLESLWADAPSIELNDERD